ncbi:MAG TPA: LamG-like jellyroll fold domain-containing protein [Pedobacter sp.]|uniref:LamG-like jellyroll fold domain-containing protein n=1 Tax=Pedobacter sp. TaxID=1411316 RepID=UPI002CC90D5B|nr:LamG-like jellyroll fold domain-containing protein [Pedobacter sp.]HMI04659.1 LamG-like jellyroll fold domain-containing protein [Pedobacter sp.]
MKTIKLTGFTLAIALSIGLISCSDDDNDGNTTLPPIGGYNNAGEVGSADLLAYWPLDGNGTESISNTASSTTIGTTWSAGIKGQAAIMNGGYITYPQIAALTQTVNAFTISAWVNVKNNQTEVPGSGSVSTFFSMKSAIDDWQGNIMLYAETGQLRPVTPEGVANDSIKVKAGWNTVTNGSQIYENALHLEPWMVEENLVTPGKHVAGPNVIGGTWAQLVFTWEGATHKFIIYSNGAKISNPAFEVRGDNSTLVMDATSTPMIGAFGNVATTADTWNKPLTGGVDEIRIWKKALSQADINSLYELEKAGR